MIRRFLNWLTNRHQDPIKTRIGVYMYWTDRNGYVHREDAPLEDTRT